MWNTRRCCGASTVQSTSTTPGVDSNTCFTCAAVASRVESSAAYTSATMVESTGGPGGISATLTAAPYRRAMGRSRAARATAIAWLCRERSPLGTRFTCTSPTLALERMK